MPSKYKITDPEGIYFITFAVVEWVDVFTRPDYTTILIDSLQYCIEKKGLILHAWCIMPSHVHMIASATEGFMLSDILRDLKKFSSKKIIEAILDHPKESRRYWMLWLFKQAGERNPNNVHYQFWQQDNHPVGLNTNEMLDQRLNYLHNNPVTAGFVHEPQHYAYSSAADYCDMPGLLKVHLLK